MRVSLLTAFSVIALLGSAVVAGQAENRIEVSGTVKDASGAVVANANIVVRVVKCKCADCKPSDDCNCCANQIRLNSDNSGNFTFSVCHGTYDVSVSAEGRSGEVRLDLNEGTDRTADVKIQ